LTFFGYYWATLERRNGYRQQGDRSKTGDTVPAWEASSRKL
jgi:hypothetical protein